MARELAMTVFVEGERYDAGTVPPAEVAKMITSPHAWVSEEDAAADTGDEPVAATFTEDPDAKSRKTTRRA